MWEASSIGIDRRVADHRPPLATSPSEAPLIELRPTTLNLRRPGRVLVLESRQGLGELMCRFLEKKLDVEVIGPKKTIAGALGSLAGVDVVVSDLMLCGVTNPVAELHRARPNLPVIIYSGDPDTPVPGAFARLLKGQLAELTQSVAEALRRPF